MSTTMTTVGNAGWIQYSGSDTTAAKKFYKDVIGWNIADMPMEDGTSYSGIMLEDGPIGGFSPVPEASGGWTIYITVADVDTSTKRAKDAGATITTEPMDMPGIGRMSSIIDPQGARLSLITYESMQK